MELRVCPTCREIRSGGSVCARCQGRLTLADGSLLVGELFGKYRIDAPIGAGGMGAVFRATHQTLERPAAIKIVIPGGSGSEFERRFLQEAKLLGELKHPNIVDIYDFDVSSWAVPYLVMELLEGLTLREMLDRASGRLAPELLGPIVRDVAAGLAFAHEKGVVHRDLKPENVFVALFHDRTVGKVLDFGIAKVVAEGREPSRLTMSGVLVGTPYYLSPEQLLLGALGPAVDQYALALIVAEALTGRAVREGKTLGQIYAEDIARPVALEGRAAGLPDGLSAAIARATQPAPQERFPTVAAFVDALGLPEGDPRRIARELRGTMDPTGGGTPARTTTPDPATAMRPTEKHATPAETPAPTAALSRPLPTTIPSSPALAPQLRPGGAGGASASPAPAPVAPILTRGQWGALALGLVVLAAAVESLVPRHAPAPPPAPAPPTAAPAPPPPPATDSAPGLHAIRDVPVPADVRAILGADETTIVLQGATGIYMLPRDGSHPATPIAISGRVVGGAGEGLLDVLEGGKLVRRDAAGERRRVLVEEMPELPVETPIWVGPGGDAVAIHRDGSLHVHRIVEGKLGPAVAMPLDPSRGVAVALGRRLVGTVQPDGNVSVRAIDGGAALLEAPLREPGVASLALLEDAGLAAVYGWFDRVLLYDVARPQAPPRAHGRRGQSSAVAILPDLPTLVTAGAGGLEASRDDGSLAARIGGHSYDALVVSGGLVLGLSRTSSLLTIARFTDGALPPATKVADAPIWTLSGDAETILAGGQDGALHRILRSGEVTHHEVHTDGITAMVRRGAHLATASDDKTIAVWTLPDLKVLWRTKAHGYLVNDLRLQGEPPTLWSASSDGAIKQWDFPQLQERRSHETGLLTGAQQSLASLWISPAEERILAGTWNGAVLDLRRDGEGWSALRIPVASHGTYDIVDLPAVEALLLVGVEPSSLQLMDLRTGKLLPAASVGTAVIAGAAGASGQDAWVVGDGTVLHLRATRSASGALGHEVRAWLSADYGQLQAAALMDGKLVVGNERGEVRVLALDPASRAPMATDVAAP